MDERIEFFYWPGRMAINTNGLLEQCSDLYSLHYGTWGNLGKNPGKPIKLSIKRIKEWLDNEFSVIYYATICDKIIGYAIAINLKVKKYGIVTWVTQLVVHRDYRNRGIAKNLLYSIWGLSDHYAWGIVSANPYAIRALEKATRRRSIPIRIKKNEKKLKSLGEKNVPFFDNSTIVNVGDDYSKVNTSFYIEHSNVLEMIKNVQAEGVPWLLGMIDEGWEWFAFTFKDQEQIALTQEEIENMVCTSESVVRQAYSRMNLDTLNQKWMKNTENEVKYIIDKFNISEGSKIIDWGCGTGRHSIEFAKNGMKVIAIDYIGKNVSIANEKISKLMLENVNIREDDCRSAIVDIEADLAICLYDVIGSFTKDGDNELIVKNIYNNLKNSGIAIITVMNYESTLANAKNFFSFETEANKLLDLRPSTIMEKTGNVFDPEYYLIDDNKHIIYRKEQFLLGNELPIELIVRDKRYAMKEMKNLCEKVGFRIIDAKYVNASSWEISYEATSPRAKEILVVCTK